ncbi:MAG: tail fiber protein [Anaerolineales bacterium]|nr:tail fiber protein [Anaerolineales bacterium]
MTGDKKIRALSIDSALFPHVGDAITALANDNQWEQVGDTVAAVVAACKDAVESWYSDMLIGQVASFVETAPVGWLELDGSTHAEGDYPELFAKVPAAWISGTNFTLPDMQERFLAGVGSAGTVGATGGANTHTLTEAEMPAHVHTYTFPVVAPDTIGAGAPVPSVATVTPATPTSSTGSGNAHENRPAFLALVVAVFAGRE